MYGCPLLWFPCIYWCNCCQKQEDEFISVYGYIICSDSAKCFKTCFWSFGRGLLLFKKFCGSSLYFFVNSNLAFQFLLLMSSLHLVIWPLYFFPWSLLRVVDASLPCEGCWWSLIAFFLFFSSAHNFFPSTAAVFLGQPVWCLVVSTPVVVLCFFKDILICCTAYDQCLCSCSLWLIFPLFPASKLPFFSCRQLSGLYLGS